ncbi:MAG TPA: ribbon-helix-helix domain-containing protein [Solirubrobacterales bacterium]|nr:ribbon-helix-helix domain-containing protein [Solirubrobacterales bacterium]
MEAATILYGTMYGVKRTTIYLTDAQKQELEALSGRLTRTESDLIREGVDQVLELHRPGLRKPGPIGAFNDPVLDDPDRIDEALRGFGED